MILKTQKESSQLDRTIPLHIWLPDDYETSEERYPVIYMFDGHNLFSDEDATFGTSWGLADYLQGIGKDFIIVGMECDHTGQERLQEYSPYPGKTFFGESEGRGENLFQWIREDLKPWVDSEFRTWPHREATGIGGSSMGGLMAAYGLVNHNDIFSKAAALSPSLLDFSQEFIRDIREKDLDEDSALFLSFGENEVSSSWRDIIQENIGKLQEEFEKKGMRAYSMMQQDGNHNEESWSRLSPIWFEWLWMNGGSES